MMIGIQKEDLRLSGFNPIGSLWFSNEDDSIRIRKWKDNELDIYRWVSGFDNQIVFRGYVNNQSELNDVLKYCFKLTDLKELRIAKFIGEVDVQDNSFTYTTMSVFKQDDGGLFGIDSSYLEQVFDDDEDIIVPDVFNPGLDLKLKGI